MPKRPQAQRGGVRAARVLLQLAVRRLPGLRRPWCAQRNRRGLGHPGSRRPGSGRVPAVELEPEQEVLHQTHRGACQGGEVRRERPAELTDQDAAKAPDSRLVHPGQRALQEPLRPSALVHRGVRGHCGLPGAQAGASRVRHAEGTPAGVHPRGAVPHVQGRATEAGDSGCALGVYHAWGEVHRGTDGAVHRGGVAVPGQLGAGVPRGNDRRCRAARDPGPLALPAGRGAELPHACALRRHALRRRGAAHPFGHPDRLGPRGCAVRAGRALDRPAPAR